MTPRPASEQWWFSVHPPLGRQLWGAGAGLCSQCGTWQGLSHIDQASALAQGSGAGALQFGERTSGRHSHSDGRARL